ncbi:glycerol dehydrogenase [Gluconobacter oxydans]|uniref:Glycerol dehydrogenase small subunit n=3 Tax=Gluconobacter thailandicus TaxID=257438 RepID=SLDB_GLUTH|nr:glycerol dehydrogenase small subunit [Gluconobacter thailandicus]Q8L1D5.3 RecName: Full=Glycerol dehydrogenase small subunit; AltName: Full=D-arabitol dehydrogenase small subunit; Short=ARDH; AltName: Full=D-sorbitol dehydrogenase subunit SldB; Short=SLDH; AltName: Full=Gluconate/polyol dehydrogenase small subunit [Gluconobacter thailandicus]AFW00902.1 glycerol dehydrogenase small subunit [Gluconobacter oxydans H24]ANQ40435.1 glycerol dehydrogenase [Gluconobacter oxydans]KXV52056.1 glycerol 
MPNLQGNRTLTEWLTLLLGVIVLLVGLFFVIGGADLAMLGGSTYYVLCGILLVASGVFMLMGRTLGAFLYLGALAYTWVWSFWEVGFSPIDLLPRAFGPTILGILVALTIPVLRRMESRRTLRGAV